ncbi:hypothetical protein ABT237_22210 [Streptomyces sp. NPDC001581]|uniref:hypothetical protein n=1 Tax=Streptomyces sp. NPDC001581 TaxID=3154386 RepID=UPI003334A316
MQEQQVRDVARALLNAPIELNAVERTELQAVANGETAAAGKWDAVKKAFRKISRRCEGRARQLRRLREVVQGSRLEGGSSRCRLQAAGLGGDILTLWQMFH